MTIAVARASLDSDNSKQNVSLESEVSTCSADTYHLELESLFNRTALEKEFGTMSGYYGQQQQSGGTGGNGFYNQEAYGQPQHSQPQGGAYGGGYGGMPPEQQQQPQQPQQQSQNQNNSQQQWHQSSSAPVSSSVGGQQQQQQQQQQTMPQPGMFNPVAAAAVFSAATGGQGLNNDALLKMAESAGSNMMTSGWAQMVPGMDRAMNTLRFYFAVDNRYVKKKITRILFPFLSKQWKRMVMEVLVMRAGLWAMQAPIPMLDLFSYTGYKYLGLCINMLAGLALLHFGKGVAGYYGTFLWTASAASFFMLKTMANNIPRITAAEGPKREVMVLAFAASQCATMWFVSNTKFLHSENATSI
eukprot:scaffold42990_cov56-Attheya_sp.AAC.1